MAVFFLLLIFASIFSIKAGSFTTTKISPPPMWNSTFTDKLRQDLLLNYDKFARPAQHFNVTTVFFGLSVRHIELDEFKSTITVHSWVSLQWSDEKLKWNSSEYGDLTMLHLADHEIWQPDLALYNSATSTSVGHFSSTHCLVSEDGSVLWVPPAQFAAFCNLNLRYWPFDTQECFLKFGSWTYSGAQIDLEIKSTDLEMLVPNSEWNLKNTTMKKTSTYYPCCSEPYPDITVTFSLERASPSYKAVIITPAFVVIVLTLSIFWLPPDSGEKVILNGFTAIIVCMFMLYFTQKLPAMGSHTPLIVLFYCSCLYIIAFSMIGSITVIWISRTKHSSPLPWLIKRSLTGTFGHLLGLDSYINQSSLTSHRLTAEEMRDHQVTDFDENTSGDEHHIIKASEKGTIQQDWILFAAAIDRISFCFYCLLFAILSIAYSV